MGKKHLSDILPQIDSTHNIGATDNRWANIYADTLYGDGSNITNITTEVANTLQVTVKNVSGGELAKGTVVHVSPSASPPSGNVIEVIAADYDDATKMPAVGILKETIANEAEGEAVMSGALSGIATDGFTAGDELYVGADGALTNTKPQTAGQLIQKIAVCVKSHASNGLIKIFGAGRSNDVPLPLYIDNTNQRVGIGTAIPGNTLSVNGGSDNLIATFSSTDDVAQIEIVDHDTSTYLGSKNGLSYISQTAGTPADGLVVNSSGDVGIGTISPSEKLHVVGSTLIEGSGVELKVEGSGSYDTANITMGNAAKADTFEISLRQDPGDNYATLDYDGYSPTGTSHVRLGANYLDFNTAGSSRMHIDSSGNVGIDQTNPTYRLTIGNNGGLADSIKIGNYEVAAGTRQYIGYARHDTGLFETSSSGNTPSTVLAGVAGIRIVNTTGSVLSSKADQSVQLLTHIYNGNSRVALHANYDGNVGIGTTDPSEKLEVAGNGLFGDGNTPITLQVGEATGYTVQTNSTLKLAQGGGNFHEFRGSRSSGEEGSIYLMQEYTDGSLVRKTQTYDGETTHILYGDTLSLSGNVITTGDLTVNGDELHFPTLDLSISNNNAQNQGNTYFRGNGTHFVLGLNSGNTLYLNYGNSAGEFRAYGNGMHWNDVNIGTPWGSSNDGSGSGLDADLLDGSQGSAYIKENEDRRYKVIRFTGEGGDSSNPVINYGIYQEGGAWSSPFPDLVIGYHTGIKIGGHKNYNGTRFYNDAPGRPGASLILSVGDGSDDVVATSSFRAPIFYDSNDTDYYLDPASTGVALKINGIINQDFQSSNLNTAWTAPGSSFSQGFIVGRYQGGSANQPHHNDNANWFANIYSHASGGTASYGLQLAGSNASSGENSLSLRTVSNGTFSAWRRIYHEGHKPTYSELGTMAYSNLTGTPTIPTDFVSAANGGTFGGNLTINGNLYLGDQVRIGDDAWIEDFNVANAIKIKGNQNNGNGYIAFGSQNDLLGRAGAGALTWAGNIIWTSGNDGAGSGLDADLLDGITSTSFLRSDTQDAYTPKRIDFGSSTNWDAVGFGNLTNLHMQGHNQFWIGAGNGTWFTGTANAKASASGLAADASAAHDLLITTMQGTSTYDRGITFAVDTNGAGNGGYRLGKWHSSDEQHSSKLTVDGGLHVRGGDMLNYDYYADDYSTYWDNQGGGSYWTGDTGWIDPSITAGNAIQIQAGNTTTNSNNPSLQFHQYGYGGVQFRYDGPGDRMYLESTGSNRMDWFRNKTDHGYIDFGPANTSHAHIYTDRPNFYLNKSLTVSGGSIINSGDIRSAIFYDLDNTDYYVNPAGTSLLNGLELNGALTVNGGGATYALGVDGAIATDQYIAFIPSGVNSSPDMTISVSNNVMTFSDVSGSGYADFNVDSIRAELYYDRDDTNYYLNPASTSVINTITLDRLNMKDRGDFITFYGDDNGNHSISSRDNNGAVSDDLRVNSYHNVYFNLDSNNNNTTSSTGIYVGQHGAATGTIANAWTFYSQADGITFASGSFRAPIFYDSNDTGFYLDPASSTSRLNGIWFGKNNNDRSGAVSIALNDGQLLFRTNTDFNHKMWYYDGLNFSTNPSHGHIRFWADSSSRNSSSGGSTIVLDADCQNVHTTIHGSTRSPIFYNSNDTNYSVNPADTSYLKYLGRQAHNTGHLVGSYNNVGSNAAHSNPIYTIGSSYNPATSTLSNMYGIGYAHPNASFISFTGDSGWGMYVAADGDARVWLDGSSGRISAKGNIYAPAYYDYNNTAYYMDGSATGDSIRVAGDVVAFFSSDKRYKENIKPITSPIEKVKAMSGVTFEWNEKSHKETGKKDIGVIAQEVEKVLPEIVQTRDNGYKAVDYQKLTAVLIEAVKEQQNQIDELKSIINASSK